MKNDGMNKEKTWELIKQFRVSYPKAIEQLISEMASDDPREVLAGKNRADLIGKIKKALGLEGEKPVAPEENKDVDLGDMMDKLEDK